MSLPPPPSPDPFQPPPVPAPYTSSQPYTASPGYYSSPTGITTPPAAYAGTNASATIAFVLALLGLVFTPVVDIAAVIVGHHALATIRRTGEQGAGLAKAALAIGYSLIGISVLIVAFVVAMLVGSTAQ